MAELTHESAAQILAESRNLADLAEATAFLADDPATAPEELLPALDHPGIVADQAAIALHRLTRTPPGDDGQPILSPRFWEGHLEAVVLYMPDGVEGGGYVIILLGHGSASRKLVVELPTSLLRLLLALGQAMDEDACIHPVARGWRRPERIARMVAEQDEHQPFMEPQTVRSYVSRIKKRIRQAAEGVRDVPELFEHRRQKGVRLTTELLVVDGTGGERRNQGNKTPAGVAGSL